MGDLLRTVLPLALGAAVSPTLAALVIAIVASEDDGIRRALAFGAGAALPLLVLAAVILVTGLVGPGPGDDRPDAYVDVVFGVLLAAVAYRALQPTPTAQERLAARAVGAPGGPSRYVALGVGMMLVSTATLALVVPAVTDIARARGVGPAGEAAAVAVLVAIVLIPAWGPVAWRVAAPARAARTLKPLRRWLYDRQRPLGGWAAAAFAGYLVIRGVLELR